MAAKYFLASKSSLLIFLGHKTFCCTMTLMVLMSLVHFGLLFPFSLSNHFNSPFLPKACLPWSYFHLLFFALFFHFLYLYTHHSLSVMPIPVFSLPTFQSISASASHQQIRSHFSVLLDIPLFTLVASPSFFSCSVNLKYLLLSTLFESNLCLSEFYSGRILPKQTALKIDCSIREGVSLFPLTRIVSAPACSRP